MFGKADCTTLIMQPQDRHWGATEGIIAVLAAKGFLGN